ncbi:hypothetical protein LINGRAHAP2_LOCUS5399 [Linum grandiflorum]
MNQNEMNPWGSLKPISLFFIMSSSSSSSSSTPYDPLFSFVAALYALILLYFPGGFLCFSPVILIAAIALLCLLRLGALQQTEPTTFTTTTDKDTAAVESDSLTQFEKRDPDPDPDCFSSFVQWDVGAPLEVIYEEGEDHFSEFDFDDNRIEGNGDGIIRRYPSLSMYYPESDDGDSVSSDEFCGGGFRWEEEDREGMLIEIDLDHRRRDDDEDDGVGKKDFDRLRFCGEEENMIEIDISPGKLDDVFSGEVCDY